MYKRPSLENRLIFGGLFLSLGGDPAVVGGACDYQGRPIPPKGSVSSPETPAEPSPDHAGTARRDG